MIIGGIQKTSLIDYPNKIAAIVFTQGCNFRCGYCHNPELLEYKETNYLSDDFFAFLKTRIGKLDAVVITGGEPTLHKGLTDFIRRIKDMGFLVKLDSNGTNPQILKKLIEENLINYIAMDIKAPVHKYLDVINKNIDTKLIETSIDIIKNSKINYEFRTTIVKGQLELSDFEEIGKTLDGANLYYLQKFVPSKTIDESFMNKKSFSDEEMQKAKAILEKHIKQIYIR